MALSGSFRRLLAVPFAAAALLCGAAGRLLGNCGPFTDVAPDSFCSFVLEVFTLGITTGTTPTTYEPTASVSRLQMAAFLSRTVDSVLKRGSRRAALGRFWTPQSEKAVTLATTTGTPAGPTLIQTDGTDVWVVGSNGVSRYRASDGEFLVNRPFNQTSSLLVAMNRVFFSYFESVQSLNAFTIQDPRTNGSFSFPIPDTLKSMTFDGARIVAAMNSGPLMTITVGDSTASWATATVTIGFEQLRGTLFDGSNVWVTDSSANKLFKLDNTGAILQTVSVGLAPAFPGFDGTNIWVPNNGLTAGGNSVTVVRASSGVVLTTLTGNGVAGPVAVAFDGERVLVTNGLANTVSLFKAADFSPLGSVFTGGTPYGVCSDGIGFWIALSAANQIVRF